MFKVQEQDEQKALVTRCKREGIMIVSVENSLQFPKTIILDAIRHYVTATQLNAVECKLNRLLAVLTEKRKSLGMYIGFPDLFFPDFNLFIELKRRDGGVVSKEQEQCHKELRKRGYKVEVCHGSFAAWEVIEREREAKCKHKQMNFLD